MAATVRSLPLASLFADSSPHLDARTIVSARRHQVDLLLLARLLRERPEALTGRHRAEAVEALRTAAALNQRLLDELLGVLAQLGAAGVPALPLKGPALALLLYDDPRVRRCRDLDLLVPEERVDDALAVLRAVGYRALPRADGLSREIHLVDEARGLVLDLHWNIVGGEVPFALDFAGIWAERRLIRWGEAAFPVAPPEWLVVATCLYLIKEYPRPELVHLADLQGLLARFPDLAWGRVAAIARATGTRRICALALALLGEVAGVVPPPWREAFAADAATRAAVERVRRALAEERHGERARYLHRLQNIVAHASFRERPVDKLRVFLGLASFLIRPDGEDAAGGSGSPWRRRVARVPGVAASLVRNALRSSAPGRGVWLAGGRPRPAPGTSFHPLEEAGLLVAEATQAIYALSPSAAFLWCCFEEGFSRRLTARRYADASGRSLRVARADAGAMLRTWRAMGLLGVPSGPAAAPRPGSEARAPVPAADPPVPAPRNLPVRRRYRLLDSVFEVGFAGEALCRAVDPALRHLATAARPDATVAVLGGAAGFSVLVDGGEPDRCGTLAALAPLVKGALNAAAVNRRDFALYLHAAMLRRDDAALLLPAAPGGGKTCLAAALARARFAYHTDEITLLERATLKARGAPVALTVKDGGWPVLEPLYPELNGLVAHRRSDGKTVKYLPPPVAPGDPALDRPYPVRWIVFPRYTPAGPDRVERVPRAEGLRLLFDDCLALRLKLDSGAVQALVDWIAGIECHALTFNDLHAAVRLVEGVCGRP